MRQKRWVIHQDFQWPTSRHRVSLAKHVFNTTFVLWRIASVIWRFGGRFLHAAKARESHKRTGGPGLPTSGMASVRHGSHRKCIQKLSERCVFCKAAVTWEDLQWLGNKTRITLSKLLNKN